MNSNNSHTSTQKFFHVASIKSTHSLRCSLLAVGFSIVTIFFGRILVTNTALAATQATVTTIFDDTFQNGFGNGSYNAIVNVSAADPTDQGNTVIQVDYSGNNGALVAQNWSSPAQTGDNSIEFDIYTTAGSASGDIQVFLTGSGDSAKATLTITPNTWQHVELSFATDLSGPSQFQQLQIQTKNGANYTVYFDNIEITDGSSGGGGVPTPVELPDKTPAYYFDHETAYVIEHSIDAVNGGMFLALDPDTNDPFGVITDTVYGNAFAVGSDKNAVGQAVCVRYFVQEFQRISTSGQGVIGINTILDEQMGSSISLTESADLLTTYATACADFIVDHLTIPVDDSQSGSGETCVAGGICEDNADQGDVGQPNMYYYWASVGIDGSTRRIDDTLVDENASAARAYSSLPWSLAELALALKEQNGGSCDAGSDCAKYRDAAIDYWNWRTSSAIATPSYAVGNANDNTQVGVARDIFYAPLGYLLYQVTGDVSYRDGGAGTSACPAAINSDGTPCGGIPFINNYVGTGDAPELPYPASHALQDGAYMAGYARAIMYSLHSAEFPAGAADRAQWWDFGWFSVIDDSTRAVMSPTDLVTKHNVDYSVPFAHFAGRELLAGTQRAHMFFSSYGANPNANWPTYDATAQSKDKFSAQTVNYWEFMIDNLWDDTTGQRSWYESTSKGYKPCFSAGTEVPFADSQPPSVSSVSHNINCSGTGLTNDITFTVSTNDLSLEMPYMSWTFNGSGVNRVEVLWTCDSSIATGGDATAFNSLLIGGSEALGYSGVLTSTAITENCTAADTLFYYTRTSDNFGNTTSLSPNGSPETLTTAADWWSADSSTLTTDLAAFGQVSCSPISEVLIGDTVWIEADGDGDATNGSATPADGILVVATAGNGQTYSDTTDSNGNYTITVPANATYTVTVATPTGTTPSTILKSDVDSDPTTDDDQNHNPAGALVAVTIVDNLTIDFSFTSATTLDPVQIGNYVWFESDTNGNAIDGVIGPVTNTLVTATDASGTIYTDTTNADGLYTITVPANSVYTVTVETPGGYLPSGTLISASNSPTDTDGLSHDGAGTVVTVGSEDNLTIDFGFTPIVTTYSIGNLVWLDEEEDGSGDAAPNGTYNAGIDTLAEGVTMTLYEIVSGTIGSTPIMTTTTISGTYQFAGLPAGNYQVVIPLNQFTTNGALYDDASATSYASSPNEASGSGDDNANHNGTLDGSLGVTSEAIILGGTMPTGEAAHGMSHNGNDANDDWTIDFAFYLPDPTSVGLLSGGAGTTAVNTSILLVFAAGGALAVWYLQRRPKQRVER